MKNHNYVLRLVMTALFAAIIMLATFIHIPIGGSGYIHPGDSMIYAAAWLMGGPLSAVAAAVGSCLADIFLGWTLYAPATFLIKGIMGLIVGLLIKFLPQKTLSRIIAMSIAAVIMVLGYFLYEYFAASLLEIQKAVALVNIPWNLVQAVGGVIIGTLLIEALGKVNGINNFKNKLTGL